MEYPIIMALDGSSYEDRAFPIAAAWSLPNGEIKSTLIRPDEDWWDPDSNYQHDFDLDEETLHTQGLSAIQVAKEMETDIQDGQVFCLDPDMNDQLAVRLFDAIRAEPNFESYTTQELLPDFDAELLLEQLNAYSIQLGLDLNSCENRVRVLLEIVHKKLNSEI